MTRIPGSCRNWEDQNEVLGIGAKFIDRLSDSALLSKEEIDEALEKAEDAAND